MSSLDLYLKSSCRITDPRLPRESNVLSKSNIASSTTPYSYSSSVADRSLGSFLISPKTLPFCCSLLHVNCARVAAPLRIEFSFLLRELEASPSRMIEGVAFCFRQTTATSIRIPWLLSYFRNTGLVQYVVCFAVFWFQNKQSTCTQLSVWSILFVVTQSLDSRLE